MDMKEVKKVIRDSYNLHIEDDYGFEKFKNQVVSILTSDMAGAIKFILKDSTDEEFFWISSFFEDIMVEQPSVDFYNALQQRLQQVTCESYKQNIFETDFMRDKISYGKFVESIQREIDYAKGQLWRLEEDADDAEKE